MTASSADVSECGRCKKGLIPTDRSLECAICKLKWHYGCVGLKDALGLEVEDTLVKGIWFVCDRCRDEFKSWKDGGECGMVSRDGANEEKRGETEPESDRLTRSRVKKSLKCFECAKVMEITERKLECKCGRIVHNKCLGISDNLALHVEIQSKKYIYFLCKKCEEVGKAQNVEVAIGLQTTE